MAGDALARAERALRGLDVRVRRDVDLRTLSWWRIGGRGALLAEPQTPAALGASLRALAGTGVPVFVVGDGSNLLFDDRGFDGVLVRIGRALGAIERDGNRIVAQAGAWVPHLSRRAGSAGLAGLEHAIGIPGTVGGLVAMNGGSQRRSVGEHVELVRGFHLDGRPFERNREECGFAYRHSLLREEGLVISEVAFRLEPGDAGELRRTMIATMADRRRKFPKSLPNCGSVFVSDPKLYATLGPPGLAIERVGLKGARVGGAEISPRHANFIVNTGGARSADVLTLVRRAREAVARRTGIWMACEVRHVAPDGRVRPAHEAADELVGDERAADNEPNLASTARPLQERASSA